MATTVNPPYRTDSRKVLAVVLNQESRSYVMGAGVEMTTALDSAWEMVPLFLN